MLQNTARRAYAAYSSDRWAALHLAHTRLISGQIRTALDGFRAAQRGLSELLNAELSVWPLLSSDPAEASVSSALICIRDFYYLTNTWSAWPLLATSVCQSPHYGALPLAVRAHIDVGWAFAQFAHRSPQLIITELQRTQAALGEDDSPLARSARISLHLVIAKAYNLIIESGPAIEHAQAALRLNDEVAAPFYTMVAHREIADAYYDSATFNGDDPALFAHAEEYYTAVDDIISRIGPEAWPLSCDYDRGWMFSRIGKFELAVEHFERAAFQRAGGSALFFDMGRCYYALGFALLNLKQHNAARKSIQRAIDLFSDDDHIQMNQDALGAGTRSNRMMAVCLQILGLIEHDAGDLLNALNYLELSRDHLTVVTNAATWYDTLISLIEVCDALGEREKQAQYQAELDDLRHRFPSIG